MPSYTAAVTLLAIALYFYIVTRVPLARRRFGVSLPATSGHAEFERVFRAQQNTLEWMPIFLPLLWISAFYVSDRLAAAFGVVWVIGRALYAAGYSRAVDKRLPGFGVQALACVALFLTAAYGVARSFAG